MIGANRYFAAALLIGTAGQHVTREDGAVICTLSRDLYAGEPMTAEGWCKDWQIPPPVKGTTIPDDPPGHRWIVRQGGIWGGARLHVEDQWRPQ